MSEDDIEALARMTRPPAAESGTPAPGEVGREALVAALRNAWADCTHAVGWCRECQSAAVNTYAASLLSASPASETRPARDRPRRDMLMTPPRPASSEPASETPAPGEGDLRGEHAEGRDCADAEQRIEWLTDVLANTETWAGERAAACDTEKARADAAVEQRTLAEQKVARVEAVMGGWAGLAGSIRAFCAADIRAALADPEADR